MNCCPLRNKRKSVVLHVKHARNNINTNKSDKKLVKICQVLFIFFNLIPFKIYLFSSIYVLPSVVESFEAILSLPQTLNAIVCNCLVDFILCLLNKLWLVCWRNYLFYNFVKKEKFSQKYEKYPWKWGQAKKMISVIMQYCVSFIQNIKKQG